MFKALFNPLKTIERELAQQREQEEPKQQEAQIEEEKKEKVAIIQGRFCLAYQGTFCSLCRERCPEQGAIVVTNGIPMVNEPDCTGCGICHDVCPAPRNAVLMLEKRT